jgi:hypothetical protein
MKEESVDPTQVPNPQEPTQLSRRRFIQGASALGGVSGAVAAAGLAGYEKHEGTGWLTSFTNDIPIDPAAGDEFAPVKGYTSHFTPESVKSNEQYERAMTDPRYLKWLFEQLRSAAPEAGNGEATIRQALRLVRGPESDPYGIATATMLDQGGLYLAARHTVEDATIRYVDNVRTNRADRITAAFVHEDADIALLVAPSGHAPQPLPGIQFASQGTTIGQELYLNGFVPFNEQVYQYRKSGAVTQHVSATQVAIDGLIPLGGTSGSTICDTSGSIVGIEYGVTFDYPEGPNDISNYKGADMTPIANLADVSRLKLVTL